MSKHTPGPWLTEEEEFIESTGHLYTVWVAKNEGGKPGGRIAQAYSNCLADEEACRANSRLIAAAPDMLEALKSCLWALEAFALEGIHAMPNHPLAPMKLAKEAIAKAELSDIGGS